MAFCDEKVIYNYFTVSRVYRNNSPTHYAFVGIVMLEKYKDLFDLMSNGNIPDKSYFFLTFTPFYNQYVNFENK